MTNSLRIGFVTYEYPPDIVQGGIATYVEQVANILKKRNHDIEIFCASHARNISEEKNGIMIHRCLTKDASSFKYDCLEIFSQRHTLKEFDIIECPEIHADAFLIKEKFLQLPLVVKLHMALFIQMRLYNFYTSNLTRLRFFLGALKQGRLKKFGEYNYKDDIEYKMASMADAIVSPSKSLREIIIKEWKFLPASIKVIPYPFSPPENLLQIPIKNKTKKVVSFIGKLNVHKGIVNLVKAIPLVVKKHPDVIFRMVGNDSFFAAKKMNMSAYIKKQLRRYEKNYEILGGLKYADVLKQYSNASVCIFPSIWENFPLVCLEAMSAGRAIIGSKEGGMNEMLDNNAGIIIDPLSIKEIAEAIIKLLDSEILRHTYGLNARTKVLQSYNPELIGKQMEDHFSEVINKKIFATA